jgi:hypothetical protein
MQIPPRRTQSAADVLECHDGRRLESFRTRRLGFLPLPDELAPATRFSGTFVSRSYWPFPVRSRLAFLFYFASGVEWAEGNSDTFSIFVSLHNPSSQSQSLNPSSSLPHPATLRVVSLCAHAHTHTRTLTYNTCSPRFCSLLSNILPCAVDAAKSRISPILVHEQLPHSPSVKTSGPYKFHWPPPPHSPREKNIISRFRSSRQPQHIDCMQRNILPLAE